MKPQQRKFTVEFKSARRRVMSKPSSIWGDTDLKALVRQAETEAPHLFELPERPGELSSELNYGPAANEATASDVADVSSTAPVSNETMGAEFQADFASNSSLEQSSTKVPSPEVPTRKRRAPIRRRATRGTNIVTGDEQPDDLAALEDENRRLKTLLAQRLRQENVRLQEMLQRFQT